MERTSGCRKDLWHWRVAVALALVLAVDANAFHKPWPTSQDARGLAGSSQPSRTVRSKPGRSNLPRPPAVSIAGLVYSSASASVRCDLLNASTDVASSGTWYWTVEHPATGARGHLLRAVANKTISVSLPSSLRGSIAVSEDRRDSTLTLCNVQQLRSHVSVSCLWKSSRGTQRRGINAQPHTRSAVIYGEGAKHYTTDLHGTVLSSYQLDLVTLLRWENSESMHLVHFHCTPRFTQQW